MSDALEGRSSGAFARHREPDPFGVSDTEEVVEHDQTVFRPVDAAKPDGLSALQVTDDDAVDVAFANGDLVDADHRGPRVPEARQLRAHVQLVHLFDGMPLEVQIRRHFFDGGAAALLAHVEGEPFRVVRIGREPVEPFPLHAAAQPAADAPYVDLEPDAQVAARQIADTADGSVVPRPMAGPTRPASCFFPRRLSVITRARGSPTTPTIVRPGVKPGNRYASRSSRWEGRKPLIPL